MINIVLGFLVFYVAIANGFCVWHYYIVRHGSEYAFCFYFHFYIFTAFAVRPYVTRVVTKENDRTTLLVYYNCDSSHSSWLLCLDLPLPFSLPPLLLLSRSKWLLSFGLHWFPSFFSVSQLLTCSSDYVPKCVHINEEDLIDS